MTEKKGDPAIPNSMDGPSLPFIRQVLLAVLSGVLLTASFPPGRLSFLAWVALVPILKAIEGASFTRAFRLGFVLGTVHYLTLIYWIVEVLGRYGNLNPLLSTGPLLLLCGYLALYPALFAALFVRFGHSRFLSILGGGLWVGLEFLRGKILGGFPWCLLGYSQYQHLHLIQVADLAGVYGVSFVLVLSNVLIYRLFSRTEERRGPYFKWEALLTATAILGALAYGHHRLSHHGTEKAGQARVRTAIIQANIDQSVKWEPVHQKATMAIYEQLTRSTFGFKPELVVWPEAAVPFFFQSSKVYAPRILSLVEASHALLIFGSPAFKKDGNAVSYYNRAYAIGPGDTKIHYYDKVHLVPFGEYVPLKRLLFFIQRLVPAAGDFQAGRKVTPIRHGRLSPGILICFEAIFPDLARRHVKQGARLLINITNDAWFGMTSAPYQHLSMAAFRAVENRRPVIRAANTGFSAYVAPTGEIRLQGDLFQKQVLKTSVPIPGSRLTFYSRFGDLFVFLLMALCLATLIPGLRRRKEKSP
jgi:apolipoprotein N-acyltransferase